LALVNAGEENSRFSSYTGRRRKVLKKKLNIYLVAGKPNKISHNLKIYFVIQ